MTDRERSGPPSPISLLIRRAEGVIVVTLHGDLDAGTSETLGKVLTDLIEGQGNLAVVLDMRHVHVVDPEGLTMLRVAAEQAGSLSGRFALSEVSAEAHRTLDEARLFDVVEIVDPVALRPREAGEAYGLNPAGREGPIPGARTEAEE